MSSAPVGSPGGSGNIPNPEPNYKITIQKDGQTEIVVFKTPITMELGEQVKRIANLALLTLVTFGGALMDRNIRNEWKTAIEGKHYSRLKIEKEFVPDDVIGKALHGKVSWGDLKMIAARMMVIRKIKMYGKEKIEIERSLAKFLNLQGMEIPEYHVVERENLYYLVKNSRIA